MQIRPATAGDTLAINALLARTGLLPLALERFEQELYLIAHHQQHAVGAVGMEICDQNGLLKSLTVDPDYRNQGFGTALVTGLIKSAGEGGIEALYLLTNEADRLFIRLGFESIERASAPLEIRQTNQFRGDYCASATCYRKLL